FPELSELQALRRRPVIVYALAHHPLKPLDDGDAPILYDCLSRLPKTDEVDVVLHASGGLVSAARRIALLLRESAGRLNVLVPYRARSAATLLCLAADELVLGPLAELSPLDPNIRSSGDGPPGSAPLVSAEDVRAFPKMAAAWFGLENA